MKKTHLIWALSIVSFSILFFVWDYRSNAQSSQAMVDSLNNAAPLFNPSQGHRRFVFKAPQEAVLNYTASQVTKIAEQTMRSAAIVLDADAGHLTMLVNIPSKEVIKYASLRKIPVIKLVETNALLESEKIIASLESKAIEAKPMGADSVEASFKRTITKATLSDIKPITHTISAGDTLSSISEQYHTTIWKIRQLNHLKPKAVLQVGRVLTVLENEDVLAYEKFEKEKEKKWVASVSAKLSKIALDRVKTKSIGTLIPIADSIATKPEKATSNCERMISLAKTKLGRRYVWGANGSDDTYDCSSFTKFVYKSIGIYIPRTSIRQSKYGKFVKRDELKRGDLIFFDTSKEHKGFVNHVGIYLGNNRFIHASSAKHKVIITKLEKNFYSRRYKGARRPSS